MIVRAADVLLTVLIGLGIGYWLRTLEPRMPLQASSERSAPPAASEGVSIAGDVVVEPCAASVAASIPELAPAPPLPAPYLEMIGPLEEPAAAASAYDRYAALTREARDESWAAAMEAGVALWAETVGERNRAAIDYVECRSRSCIVAGRSQSGNTAFLDELGRQGWWQAEPLRADYFYGASPEMFFLLFVQRNPD